MPRLAIPLMVLGKVTLHSSLPRLPAQAVLSRAQLKLGCLAGPQQQARPDPCWRKQIVSLGTLALFLSLPVGKSPWEPERAQLPGHKSSPLCLLLYFALRLSPGVLGVCLRYAGAPAPAALCRAGSHMPELWGWGRALGAGCGRGEVMGRSWAPAPRAALVLSWLQWTKGAARWVGMSCFTPVLQDSALVKVKRVAGRAQVSWEGAAVTVPLSAPGAGWIPTVSVPNLPSFPWVSVPPDSSSADGCVCSRRWWGAVSGLNCSYPRASGGDCDFERLHLQEPSPARP